MNITKIGLICGGPSPERGISLNSARSVYDHLAKYNIDFQIFYVNQQLDYYLLNASQLYSNTPSDFDFKLSKEGKKMAMDLVIRKLKSCDLVFPCIHGEYGEDGQLQKFLESIDVEYVGSKSLACSKALDKYSINKILLENNFPVLNLVKLDISDDNLSQKVEAFFKHDRTGKVIGKPLSGGSSIGVKVINSVEDAISHVALLEKEYGFRYSVLESFCTGREFTVVVLQNSMNIAVALPPTEVIFQKENNNDIFDFRKKYLPTENTRRPCPPVSFGSDVIEEICESAELIFDLFGMRDMVRLDGFYSEDKKLYFTDLNPVSGMEQNSFIFQQASRIGWYHHHLMSHLVNRSLLRAGKQTLSVRKAKGCKKDKVFVLFGGDSVEKEVSVMSGTNIWLKLKQSNIYEPIPFIWKDEYIWKLPYAFCLDHTVSEIIENCNGAENHSSLIEDIQSRVRKSMGIDDGSLRWEMPERFTMEEFLNLTLKNNAFVFLGLHGGDGENGELQRILDEKGIAYNGSNAIGSELCMDKYETGRKINETIGTGISYICSAPKKLLEFTIKKEVSLNDCIETWKKSSKLWDDLNGLLKHDIEGSDNKDLLIKPRYDGCSYGIVHLKSPEELYLYTTLMGQKEPAPTGSFAAHSDQVEMNFDFSRGLLLEPFVETVKLYISGTEILPDIIKGWVELTVGVVEGFTGLHALMPSLTVAEDAVLSLEEKFQGGTGVNLTPPSENIISYDQCRLIRAKVEEVAVVMGIEGYARIDIFFNTETNDIIVIEANSLPGLTPSTVIFHQALADETSMAPTQFLEYLISSKIMKIERKFE